MATVLRCPSLLTSLDTGSTNGHGINKWTHTFLVQKIRVAVERNKFFSIKTPSKPIERNERSDFGCLLKLWGTRVCLANFVNQSGFRKLAANQSQVEGNRGKNVGYLDMQLKSLLSFISMTTSTKSKNKIF